jgi:hypothetical protein
MHKRTTPKTFRRAHRPGPCRAAPRFARQIVTHGVTPKACQGKTLLAMTLTLLVGWHDPLFYSRGALRVQRCCHVLVTMVLSFLATKL